MVLCAVAFTASAQPERYQWIEVGDKSVGRTSGGGDIVAREYRSPWAVFDAAVDPATGMMLVFNRETGRGGRWANMGNVMAYDMAADKMYWAASLANWHTQYIHTGRGLIKSWEVSKNSYGLNIKTGAQEWENDVAYYYVDTLLQIGVGYKFNALGEAAGSVLYGTDLGTGRKIWERKLPRRAGWNGVLRLGESTLLVASGGLHSVDLRTGQGWSVDMVTGRDEYNGEVIEKMGRAEAMTFATNYTMRVKRGYTHQLASNIVADGGMAYFAGHDKIVCVDMADGRVVWEHRFAAGAPAGNSDIFVRGDRLYMFSKGYGIRNNARVNCGTSFFSCFDKKNGSVLFDRELGSTRGVIGSVAVAGDFVYALTGGAVSKYSLADGSTVAEATLFKGRAAEGARLVSGGYYVKVSVDGNPEYFHEVKNGSMGVYVPSSGLSVLNDDLSLKVLLLPDSVYWPMASTDGFRLLTAGAATVVVDGEGNPVSEINIGDRAFVAGDFVYGIDGNSVVKVAVSQITGK